MQRNPLAQGDCAHVVARTLHSIVRCCLQRHLHPCGATHPHERTLSLAVFSTERPTLL
jgi:hypothetical protein